MIVTIHQPEHQPWLGFFNKMSMSDVYVILDDVQYVKNNYQNRNRIMGSNGPQWLSVPVVNKGRIETTILDIVTNDEQNPVWRKKYLNTIEMSYRKKPYFNDIYPFVEKTINSEIKSLFEINYALIMKYAELLDIKPKFVRASRLKKEGKKSNLVLSICKNLGADIYISGEGGRHYMHLDDFRDSGVNVLFQKYSHPIYNQHSKREFEPYMSTMDLLMNVPLDQARSLIRDYGQMIE